MWLLLAPLMVLAAIAAALTWAVVGSAAARNDRHNLRLSLSVATILTASSLILAIVLGMTLGGA